MNFFTNLLERLLFKTSLLLIAVFPSASYANNTNLNKISTNNNRMLEESMAYNISCFILIGITMATGFAIIRYFKKKDAKRVAANYIFRARVINLPMKINKDRHVHPELSSNDLHVVCRNF